MRALADAERRRQCRAYVRWLTAHALDHWDAFTDVIDADAR